MIILPFSAGEDVFLITAHDGEFELIDVYGKKHTVVRAQAEYNICYHGIRLKATFVDVETGENIGINSVKHIVPKAPTMPID